MSHLIARLMLALFMLPIAAVVYIVAMVCGIEVFGFWDENRAFGLAGLVTIAFVVLYWLGIWYRSVTWTRWRRAATMVISGFAMVVGIVTGLIAGLFEPSFGIFVGTATFIFAWLIGTVFAWRETQMERMVRIRAAGTDAIVCAQCGYNLTGLRQTTCPECGAAPTLNELYAAQPRREEEELSSPLG